MNLRNKYRDHNAEVGTGSLNDILFILLLFFLIVSTLANPNVIKLALPNSSGTDESKQTVVISVDTNLTYYVGTEILPWDSIENKVKPMLASQEDPTIVINADKKVPLEYVVNIMSLARNLKAKSVLATSPVALQGVNVNAVKPEN